MAETPILRLPTGHARSRARGGVCAAADRRRRCWRRSSGAGSRASSRPRSSTRRCWRSGSGDAARAATFRFVEPSSGEVVALRPDITPQIARLIATRYRDEPGPVRLCYEGTVVRLERGARGQRELMQAGVELAGVPGPDGDADAIALAVEALAAVGLRAADDRSRPPRPRARGAVGARASRRGAGRGAPLHRASTTAPGSPRC